MSPKHYDIRQVAITLGLKPKVVGELIKKMAPSAEDQIASLKKYMKKKDHAKVFSTAHSLKGLAANFRFDGLADTARSVETAAKSEDDSYYAVLLAGLEEELKVVKEVAARF